MESRGTAELNHAIFHEVFGISMVELGDSNIEISKTFIFVEIGSYMTIPTHETSKSLNLPYLHLNELDKQREDIPYHIR